MGRVGAWSPRISYARTPQTRTCPLALLILHHRRPSCSRSSTHAYYLRVEPRLLHFDRHSDHHQSLTRLFGRSLLALFGTAQSRGSRPILKHSWHSSNPSLYPTTPTTSFRRLGRDSSCLQRSYLRGLSRTTFLLPFWLPTAFSASSQPHPACYCGKDDPLRVFVSPQSCNKPVSSSSQITAISNLPTQSTTTFL